MSAWKGAFIALEAKREGKKEFSALEVCCNITEVYSGRLLK